MCNWCATNWRIVGSAETINSIAESLNKLLEPTDIPVCYYGPTWLANGYALLNGYPREQHKDFINKIIQGILQPNIDLRGLFDPNPWAEACLGIERPAEGSRFVPYDTKDGRQGLSFSTQSAWDTPDWLKEYFEQITKKNPNFEYGYRATDDCGNFFIAFNSTIIGNTYEISCPYGGTWGTWSPGQEEEFLKALESFIHVTIDRDRFAKGDHSQIYEEVKKYNNTKEDDEISVYIFKETLS